MIRRAGSWLILAGLVALAWVGLSHGGIATFTATAYCDRGITATGTRTHYGSVAVDPAVIPLGSRVWVAGYGFARAEDTGALIRGRRIDIWLPSCRSAFAYGVARPLVRWWPR